MEGISELIIAFTISVVIVFLISPLILRFMAWWWDKWLK